jgi:D-arabinose 1-dehydrogenase-like Zn-dependent alcohol dehydrogenase
MGNRMLLLLQENKLNALVEKVISLDEVPAALDKLATRRVKGKIVAVIDK